MHPAPSHARARLAAALLAALLAAAVLLALAPSSASALTCATPPPLQEFMNSDAAFVGQVVERREETAVMTVLEAFKGVAAGDVVEVRAGRVQGPGSMTDLLTQVGQVANVYANRGSDGILGTGVCRSAPRETMRLAAQAVAQGRSCGAQPRVVWLLPETDGRVLTLRVVVAPGSERAPVIRVDWGAQVGIEGFQGWSVRRVPRSGIAVLRHRYRGTGDVRVRTTIRPPAPALCGYGDARDVAVRFAAAARGRG